MRIGARGCLPDLLSRRLLDWPLPNRFLLRRLGGGRLLLDRLLLNWLLRRRLLILLCRRLLNRLCRILLLWCRAGR